MWNFHDATYDSSSTTAPVASDGFFTAQIAFEVEYQSSLRFNQVRQRNALGDYPFGRRYETQNISWWTSVPADDGQGTSWPN